MCCDNRERLEIRQSEEKKKERHSKVRQMSKRGDAQRVGDKGRGSWMSSPQALRVSQGANMQGKLPDSPWYWLVLRPGIHLAHAHFTLSVVGRRGWVRAGCVRLCVYISSREC